MLSPHPLRAAPGRHAARLLAASLAVLVVSTSSACGSLAGSSTDRPDGGTDAFSMPQAEGTTSYPLTIRTWLGESTLQERPERIAVIGYSGNLDALEAVGVAPVYYGGRDAEADYGWNDPDFLAAIERKDAYDDFAPKPEAIAAADPDLIVTLGILTEKAEFDRLSSIAPVLELPADPGEGDKVDWRAAQAQVGEALDLSAAASKAVSDADDRLAEVASAHPEFKGRTATIMYDYGPEWGTDYYTVAGGPAEGLMLDLGFDPNPLAEEFAQDPAVSDERQDLLDADALVVIYNNETDREARESQRLFQAVPAVRDGAYESLLYPADGSPNGPLTTSQGREVPNAVWPLRRGASAVSLPWSATAVADQWLADIPLQ